MNKKIHKLIRYSKDGVNVVGDINAAIATNEPGQQVSTSSVRTRNRIVQRNGKTWTQTEFETPNEKEVNP